MLIYKWLAFQKVWWYIMTSGLEITELNHLINCKDCKMYGRYIRMARSLRKIYNQIHVITERIDDDIRKRENALWSHIDKEHFIEDKKE